MTASIPSLLSWKERLGRATIVALNMNNAVIVYARRRWVSVGWHPPE